MGTLPGCLVMDTACTAYLSTPHLPSHTPALPCPALPCPPSLLLSPPLYTRSYWEDEGLLAQPNADKLTFITLEVRLCLCVLAWVLVHDVWDLFGPG